MRQELGLPYFILALTATLGFEEGAMAQTQQLEARL